MFGADLICFFVHGWCPSHDYYWLEVSGSAGVCAVSVRPSMQSELSWIAPHCLGCTAFSTERSSRANRVPEKPFGEKSFS